MRRSTVFGGAVLLLLAAIAAACGGGDDAADTATTATTAASNTTAVATTPTSTTAPALTTTEVPVTTTSPADRRDAPPYAFDTVTLALRDDSRTTTSSAGEVVPSRSLPTTLYLPASDEPVPLIVFSHGFGASPAKFERLFAAWATAGYAVAAPAFPLTSDLIDGSQRLAGDVANQPADVVFVLDQVVSSEYGDRIDTSRVAAAGLSLGGLTTYLAAIGEQTRDPRFTAAIVMAAVPPGDSFVPHTMPVLVMHGELDPVVPLATADAIVAELTGPTYGVTMLGAFHAEAFEDEEENAVFPDREKFHPIVDATTTAFWDTFLLADPTAEPGIAAAGDRAGITRFVAD